MDNTSLTSHLQKWYFHKKNEFYITTSEFCKAIFGQQFKLVISSVLRSSKCKFFFKWVTAFHSGIRVRQNRCFVSSRTPNEWLIKYCLNIVSLYIDWYLWGWLIIIWGQTLQVDPKTLTSQLLETTNHFDSTPFVCKY